MRALRPTRARAGQGGAHDASALTTHARRQVAEVEGAVDATDGHLRGDSRGLHRRKAGRCQADAAKGSRHIMP